MVSDYISREALKEIIHAHHYRLADAYGSRDWGMFTIGIDQAIDELPAADVEPVRHGEWVVSRTDRGWNCAEFPTHCNCSLCNMEISYLHKDNYCPSCGAKMTGGDHDAAD